MRKVLGQETTTRAGFQSFTIEVRFEGGLAAAAKAKLLDEISQRCPLCDTVADWRVLQGLAQAVDREWLDELRVFQSDFTDRSMHLGVLNPEPVVIGTGNTREEFYTGFYIRYVERKIMLISFRIIMIFLPDPIGTLHIKSHDDLHTGGIPIHHPRRLIMSNVASKEGSCECFPKGPLATLIEEATKLVKAQGYKKESLRCYRVCWECFANFVHQHYGVDYFCTAYVQAFLESQWMRSGHPESLDVSHRRTMEFALRVLTELVLHGSFLCRPSKNSSDDLPQAWRNILDDYRNYMRNNGAYDTTAEDRHSFIRMFLRFLIAHRVSKPDDIRAHHVTDFLRSRAHLTQATLHSYARRLSSFLHYLYLAGGHPSDLSGTVPKFPRGQETTLPAIWTADEVERILRAVDVSSPCGKRNYAMLLLAVRLGMRVGDIKSLRLDNLEWEKKPYRLQAVEDGRAIDFATHGRDWFGHYRLLGKTEGRKRIIAKCLYPRSRRSHRWEEVYNLSDALAVYRRRAGIPPNQ